MIRKEQERVDRPSSTDLLGFMVRHKELLLPTHEDRPSLALTHRQSRSLKLVSDRAESREARPVREVTSLGRSPILSGDEAESTANDLCVEVGRQLRVVLGQILDTQIAA